MNKIFSFSLLILHIVMASSVSAAPSALDVMKTNEENRKVTDFQGKATLSTGPVGGTPKTKEFTIFRKVQTDGVHNSTLTRFHSPAEVRNEGILILENSNGNNDVLLYLPNFKKTRRVETQQQSGSFMGSVFSYSDIATPHVDDYSYKMLKSEPCPTPEAKGVKCYVIECTPTSDIIRERTGYSKSILWVRQDNSMGVFGHYYNLADEHFKTFESAQIKIIDAQKKKWLAHLVTMTNLNTKEFTTLTFANVKANQGIPDATFTQQNLQKIK